MPKRTDIKKILIIGAGPIIIGQACEFDYSGTQACKALKEEGYQIVLVNSNPATIMTDPSMADATYIEPLTVDMLTKIIEKERPCAILSTVGGQTALNLSMQLHKTGALDRYGVEMIGAKPDVIYKAEARNAFKKAMEKIGLSLPKSDIAYTLDESREKAKLIGYPVVIRPAFTLGGTGGGIAEDEASLLDIVEQGLMNSVISEILIEESIVGWKEYELEVMRDKKDNVVIVCSIENIDAMGVHTGDSITVAPAQTLTDVDYQKMRNAAIAIIREIGVDTGGSNVQFAINPKDGHMIVIEMNPRVSRSSALASKATGFPIAKLAAKLSVGYTLDELNNDITQKTPACFEPALDYCVIKMPRFDDRKFSPHTITLGTSMKSVGEAMAIGRTFKEAFQKGLRSLELNRFGFGFDGKDLQNIDAKTLKNKLKTPTPNRLSYVKYALDQSMDIHEIYALSGIDPWFLYQMNDIINTAPTIDISDYDSLRQAKRMGFSDHQIAILSGEKNELVIRKKRQDLNIFPTYSLVDTCAAEFEAYTPYYYSTYETVDERRSSTHTSVMILGSGPNRIGQGIEFDYCCVHASFALRESSFESIMVNSNPETVSTDFDISDKLFFEPLTFEDVLNIYDAEKPTGVIVQFGGQTPLNLAEKLEQAGVNILGTSLESIDRCEDREKTTKLLSKCGLKQSPNAMAASLEEALSVSHKIGYPIVVRPSYVIGGTSMKIVFNDDDLIDYMKPPTHVSSETPVLIDKFLDHAIEVDVDCISDGKEALVIGILQHIEPAGIHSGDSACVFPPYSISDEMQDNIKKAAIRLAKELHIIGLLNTQFAIKNNDLYVLEVNPRASRTVPFICKASGIPWIKMATKIIMGDTIESLHLKEVVPPYFSVKESVFPFNRFESSDILLGPEMKSTGEVMGIDDQFSHSFLKSQLATRQSIAQLPKAILVTVDDLNKPFIIETVKCLQKANATIYATSGTQKFLSMHQIPSTIVSKIKEGQDDSILHIIRQGIVELVFNTTSKVNDVDEKIMRRTALLHQIPFITSVEAFNIFVNSILTSSPTLTVESIQNHYKKIAALQ